MPPTLIKIPGSAWAFDTFCQEWRKYYRHHQFGPKGKHPNTGLYFGVTGYWFGRPNRKIRKALKMMTAQ